MPKVGEGIVSNPEPIINAVLAALEAQRSAFLTNWLLASLLIVAVALVIAVLIAVSKIIVIQQQTDGMHKSMIEATRKLALIEGEVIGREGQKKEDKADDVVPAKAESPTVNMTVEKMDVKKVTLPAKE
jgi:hypothetical protein